MCCSTGVCGPQVDWLKGHGVAVERFNLSHSPAAFVANPLVSAAMRERDDALPLVLVDEAVVAAADAASMQEAASEVLRPEVELPGALRWLRRRTQLVHAGLAAGESGGGNLTLATGLALLRDGDIGLIKGLYALSPYLAGRWPSAETPSSSENDGILLSLHNNRGAMAYGLDALERRNPLAWPAFAGDVDVKGLPPTVIHVNECDPLRDEGINFYRLLVKNGVAARCRQIMGTVHGAELFAAVCPDVSRDAARDLAAFASDAPTARAPGRAATYGFRATMNARPGQGDALAEALLDAVNAGGPASNPDCVFFVVTRSAGNRDVVHVTEGWTTKEAHAENFARESSRAFTAKLAALVGDAQYGDDVPAGGKFNL